MSRILERLPPERVTDLLLSSVSRIEITRMLSEKVPPERLLPLLAEYMASVDLGEIEIVVPILERGQEQQKKKIAEKYERSKAEPNRNLKGRLLEEVIKEIVHLVPNLRVVGSRINDQVEEIDLQVRNHNREHVWDDFDSMIFIECKNWSKAVGADEIRSFKVKLEQSKLHSGIFVAVKVITGGSESGASGVIRRFLQDGYRIVILDDNDLKDIIRCRDVSEKVDEKFVKLYQI